jgi:hypothetical protein
MFGFTTTAYTPSSSNSLDKPVEDESGLLRARMPFGVALEGQDPPGCVAQTFERVVVGVHGPGGEPRPLERIRVDSESVILAHDHRPPIRKHDRLVLAAVSEFELERGTALGECDQLVPKADPERRMGRS